LSGALFLLTSARVLLLRWMVGGVCALRPQHTGCTCQCTVADVASYWGCVVSSAQ
jgi:hypothetical protein